MQTRLRFVIVANYVDNAGPMNNSADSVLVVDSLNKVYAGKFQALKNLSHRGAVGGDLKTGDGAGLLFQVPHRFFKKEVQKLSSYSDGEYAVAQIFFPNNSNLIKKCKDIIVLDN